MHYVDFEFIKETIKIFQSRDAHTKRSLIWRINALFLLALLTSDNGAIVVHCLFLTYICAERGCIHTHIRVRAGVHARPCARYVYITRAAKTQVNTATRTRKPPSCAVCVYVCVFRITTYYLYKRRCLDKSFYSRKLPGI